MKKFITFAIVIFSFIILGNKNTFFAQTKFLDIPNGFWAESDIYAAVSAGIMSGVDENSFGTGEKITRGEFVSILSRMFGFEEYIPENESFIDTSKNKWYFKYAETALHNGIIENDDGYFRPEEYITREEIAVMLIKSLGYDDLAKENENSEVLFGDVDTNKGYISLANEFGIISGKSENSFAPLQTATREETASMMIRCLKKYNLGLSYIHGFYAFSSWNQKEMAAKMDEVSFGWGKMEVRNGEAVLNTLSENGNEWFVPNGYEEAVEYLKGNNVKTNLNVYMSVSEDSTNKDILNNEVLRRSAVEKIIEELTVNYKKLGYNPYRGVTIDFENLYGDELKNNFVLFLGDLKTELNKIDKKLYVAVQPNMKTSTFFNGYDFYNIGNLADKVILMAYDYQAVNISQSVMNSGFTTTPVTPFNEVYYALKTLTDKNSGVSDRSKIVLGLSLSSVAWNKTDGIITNSNGAYLPYSSIYDYIINGTAIVKYSEKYKNPYISVKNGNQEMISWYEDSRSIEDKITLANMFGIDKISVWRLGIIPDYDSKTNLNIWSRIISGKSK